MRSCCSGRTGDGRLRAISVAERSEKHTAYPALVYRKHSRCTQERNEESKKRLVRSLLLKKLQVVSAASKSWFIRPSTTSRTETPASGLGMGWPPPSIRYRTTG